MRGAVILTERPRVLERNDDGRLHCDDGPALLYPDGWGIWAVNGVRVPQKVVEQPSDLTTAEILGEQNAEVRRVMIDRFGAERLIRKADAQLVAEDDYGRLWRLELTDDPEPLVMVEVVNSTPEPDGSSKTYWLRVPPDSTSPLGAVAWTFDQTPDDYAQLAVQT